MFDVVVTGLSGLTAGVLHFSWQNGVMLLIAFILLYLGIKKDCEPLLLVPIGFGAILVNVPLSELMHEGGMLNIFYRAGVLTELFPLLIFVGIGAMTDFEPLLENP
jgi:oxaloacetate decarboxylase beta subunit